MSVTTSLSDPRYSFKCSWLDPSAGFERNYILSFYLSDGTLDIYDIKNHRMFLKRCKAKDLDQSDLFIGATVEIYSRMFKITDYGDEYTRKSNLKSKERVCLIIKPDVYDKAGEIILSLSTHPSTSSLSISQLRTFRLNKTDISSLFSTIPFTHNLFLSLQYLANDLFIAADIVGEDARAKVREWGGEEDPEEARKKSPSSIRAKYGKNEIENAIWFSSTEEDTQHTLLFLFDPSSLPHPHPSHPSTSLPTSSTLAIILPHIIKDNNNNFTVAGKIIKLIQDEGFDISAMELFVLSHQEGYEFLKVYQGIIKEFSAKVDELTSGPCLVMEIRGENVQKEFRSFCGPYDPIISSILYPSSIRSLFGLNKIKNAIHCTDLDDDTALESEFFFQTLQ